MNQICRLTPKGLQAFENLIAPSPSESLPGRDEILEDLVEILENQQVSPGPFWTRFELGKYCCSLLADLPVGIDRDRAFWAWLSLLWVDWLRIGKNGKRVAFGKLHRWIPEVEKSRTFHRHLVAGPTLIYSTHRDEPRRAMAVLCGLPSAPGEVAEQLMSNRELSWSPGVMELATRLYFNPETGSLRKGAGGKEEGAARRLVDVLWQLDRTWDVASMSSGELLDLLPGEFDRFSKYAQVEE